MEGGVLHSLHNCSHGGDDRNIVDFPRLFPLVRFLIVKCCQLLRSETLDLPRFVRESGQDGAFLEILDYITESQPRRESLRDDITDRTPSNHVFHKRRQHRPLAFPYPSLLMGSGALWKGSKHRGNDLTRVWSLSPVARRHPSPRPFSARE